MHKLSLIKKIISYFIAVISLVLPFNKNSLANEKPLLKIALGDWCPYSCNPEKEAGKIGYIAEILTLVFERAGFEVQAQSMSFSRSLHDVRDGKFTVMSAMFTQDAPDFIFPKQAIGNSINYFYVAQNSPWRYQGFESLSQLKSLGLIQNYSYAFLDTNLARFFEEYPHNSDYITGNQPLERNINKILSKRIDALIEDKWVMAYVLQKMALSEQVTQAGQIGKSLAVYVGFSPAIAQADHYVFLLEEGIKHLKKTGEFQQILNRYGINDDSSLK